MSEFIAIGENFKVLRSGVILQRRIAYDSRIWEEGFSTHIENNAKMNLDAWKKVVPVLGHRYGFDYYNGEYTIYPEFNGCLKFIGFKSEEKCRECGFPNFDPETGICPNCGEWNYDHPSSIGNSIGSNVIDEGDDDFDGEEELEDEELEDEELEDD